MRLGSETLWESVSCQWTPAVIARSAASGVVAGAGGVVVGVGGVSWRFAGGLPQ